MGGGIVKSGTNGEYNGISHSGQVRDVPQMPPEIENHCSSIISNSYDAFSHSCI